MQAQGIIAFVALLFLANLRLDAQILAVESTYNPAGTYYAYPADSTYGWRFTVGNTPITVSRLGHFDAGLDGLLDAHQIGIWDTAGTLVAQATVPAGTGGDLIGAYRFSLVPDTTLSANATYLIGAYYPQQSDTAIAFDAPQTYATEISYLGASYFATSGFGPPGSSYSGTHGVFGPNFQFTAIPEPEHFAILIGAGLVVFFVVRRRFWKREIAGEYSG